MPAISIPAYAQCSFDAPTKAKGFKSSMVRAFDQCTSPNTAVTGGVAACTPPTVPSSFEFSDTKSSCTLSFKRDLQIPCNAGSSEPCNNPKIRLKCIGIVESGGVTLIDSPGSGENWTLEIETRGTLDDRVGADMTAIDSSAQFLIPDGARGKLKLRTPTFVPGLLGGCPDFSDPCGLPACSSIKLIDARLIDPNGKVFAVMGSSTR